MTCPYCSQRMEKGFLSFDGRRKPLWDSLEGVKQVPLAKSKILTFSYDVEALYCEPCKKIIIDTTNAE